MTAGIGSERRPPTPKELIATEIESNLRDRRKLYEDAGIDYPDQLPSIRGAVEALDRLRGLPPETGAAEVYQIAHGRPPGKQLEAAYNILSGRRVSFERVTVRLLPGPITRL